jgi:hypothetical protein
VYCDPQDRFERGGTPNEIKCANWYYWHAFPLKPAAPVGVGWPRQARFLMLRYCKRYTCIKTSLLIKIKSGLPKM